MLSTEEWQSGRATTPFRESPATAAGRSASGAAVEVVCTRRQLRFSLPTQRESAEQRIIGGFARLEGGTPLHADKYVGGGDCPRGGGTNPTRPVHREGRRRDDISKKENGVRGRNARHRPSGRLQPADKLHTPILPVYTDARWS